MHHLRPSPCRLAPPVRRVALGDLTHTLALGLVLLSFVDGAAVWASEPEESGGRWGVVRKALVRLHDSDPNVVDAAERELASLGVSERSVALGRRLVDPDPRNRITLARALSEVDGPTRGVIVRTLATDTEPSVRIALIEAARDVEFDRAGRAALRSIAEADTDARVRGYARLLVADWPAESANDELTPASGAVRTAAAEIVQPRGGAAPHPSVRNAGYEELPGPQSPIRPASYGQPALQPQYAGAPGTTAPPTGHPLGMPSPPPLGMGDRTDVRTGDLSAARPSNVPRAKPNGLRPYWAEAPEEEDDEEIIRPVDFEGLSNPDLLNRPFSDEPVEEPLEPPPLPDFTDELVQIDEDLPYGFTGPSGILPTEGPTSPHFMPIDDRWRLGFESWDRYGKKHPSVDDYPGVEGHWWDPYNLNVLKGDYPIIGQHTFFRTTATSFSTYEFREVPTATTPFESTGSPNREDFFGDPAQQFFNQNLILQLDLFHGNAAFKPVDWQVRLTPVVNFNYLDVNELGVVNPDVTKGTRRSRDHVALQEYFVEAKLADLGPDYDFVSVRAGNQLFNSDFRGHLFFDINRGIRVFGSRFGNRDQFNLAFFDTVEKETNSTLNTFDDRHQNIFIANYYRQDFIFPGYTVSASMHYNDDQASFELDRNDFLVRPDPVGVFQPHRVQAVYLGFAGEGHIERFNVSHVTYWALGKDSLNPLAGRQQDIDAYLAALELSYDRDWIRFRTSVFYQSGDDDIHDDKAEGFDTILDDANFAGGNFSYWQRNQLRLFGANVTNSRSLVNDLRSSKTQGQANFVNPGLALVNAGMDFEITPKVKIITNVNYLWFDSTNVLEQFTFQDRIDPDIGLDSSIGMEYRPLLNDNVIMLFGFSNLIPGSGFVDLFGRTDPFNLENAGNVKADPLYAAFFELVMQY